MSRRSLATVSGRVIKSGLRCGPSSERCRYQQNWCLLAAFCSLVSFSYASALPSLHQFVTSSTRPEDPNVRTLTYIAHHDQWCRCSLIVLMRMQVQPGLGLSETWYSWIVSIISVGELVGAVATSILLQKVFTKFLMLVNLLLCGLGGLLYGLGQYGWMLLIGKRKVSRYTCGRAVIIIIHYYPWAQARELLDCA